MTKTYHSRMTSKGQITIPAEMRKELGLNPGDRVEFVRENGAIQVRRAASIVLRLAGSVKGHGRALEPDEIHEIVAQGVAEEYERELKEQQRELREKQ